MIEKPPDFDEFMEIVHEIGKLTLEGEVLEAELKLAEAAITRRCVSDPDLTPDGKVPSMTFIQNAYHYPGIDGELIPKRLRLAEVKGLLAEEELRFKVYYGMLELYRTESANRRNSMVV